MPRRLAYNYYVNDDLGGAKDFDNLIEFLYLYYFL